MGLFRGEFYSQKLRMTTQLYVIFPDPSNDVTPLWTGEPRVLYLLHGLAANASEWTRFSKIEYYAKKYNFIVIMPEVQRSFDGFSASIIFSSNLSERELIRLRRAAHAGLITMENATLLSRLTVAVFNGLFTQYAGEAMTETEIRFASEDCYNLIYALFQRFLEPGAKMDAE